MTLLGRKIKGVACCKPRKAFSSSLDQAQDQGRTTVSLGGEVSNPLIIMVFLKDE